MNRQTGIIEVHDFADAAAAAAQGFVQLTEFEVRALNRLPAAERPAALAKLRTSGNRAARRAAAAKLGRGA